MNDKRKEQIIQATLYLASEKGLRSVSMSDIAKEVGIKKPSLYNHFTSKNQLLEEMYTYLRSNAKMVTNVDGNYLDVFTNGSTAVDVLKNMISNYIKLSLEQNMQLFYKVLYSERSYSPIAARILLEETEKMIDATKQVFLVFLDRKWLQFDNVDLSAKVFALSIHSIIDYEIDKVFCENNIVNADSIDLNLIDDYISYFCKLHSKKE